MPSHDDEEDFHDRRGRSILIGSIAGGILLAGIMATCLLVPVILVGWLILDAAGAR
jgi:hypothetical protein